MLLMSRGYAADEQGYTAVNRCYAADEQGYTADEQE